MGIIRKMASITTAGAVDLRSDKERIARSGRQSAKSAKVQAGEAKKQTRLMEAQAKAGDRAQASGPVPSASVAAVAPTHAQRIAQLDTLLSQGLITPQEHAQQRQAIISSI